MNECLRCGLCAEEDVPSCPTDGSALEPSFEGSPVLDGRYRVERRLGRGGMGVVYRAVHLAMQRPVAVKVLRGRAEDQDPGAQARFRAEAVTLARLHHDAIVDVLDYGVDPRGLPYLVMELLSGGSLAERLRAPRGLALRDALVVLTRVAGALDIAHAQGILHRDVKPANVVFGSEDASTARLVDFGLARLRQAIVPAAPGFPPVSGGDPLTEEGIVVGTRGYLAPEVLEGREATSASDVYSFAVLAREVLRRVPGLTGLTAVEKRLADALSDDPSARPARASSIVAALVTGLAGAERAEEEARFRADRGRRRAVMARFALPLVAVAAALAGAGWLERVDERLLDLRFRLAPRRAPDPRIVLVPIDDATLQTDQTALADRADEVGERLGAALDAGAAGAAIDLLLPASWSRPGPFTRLVLEHADHLTLAAATMNAASSGAAATMNAASSSTEVLGPECVAGPTAVALGSRVHELFGLIDLRPAPDGVVSRVEPPAPDGDLASFAHRAASRLSGTPPGPEPRLVDYSLDARRFPRIPWHRLPETLRGRPELVRGRLLVVGGDYAVSGDLRRLAGRPEDEAWVAGMVVQATLIATLLDAHPLRESRSLNRAVAALAALLGLLAAGRTLRPAVALTSVAALVVGSLALETLLLVQARWVVSAAAPSLAAVLGWAAGRFCVRMWRL